MSDGRDEELADTHLGESEIDSFIREAARITDVAPKGAPDEWIGRRIGRFQIASRLGEGGMGVVYAAEDMTLRRSIALKLVPGQLAESEERRQRFLREARAAAAVVHPNLTTIFEVGEEDGVIFIAMEHVRGKTLRDVLEAGGGRLEIDEALRVTREIARGLGQAHSAGIVHRDIKPENVMLGDDGMVKILDFGLAKRIGPAQGQLGGHASTSLATMEGRVMGTPSYMSPEQAEGRPVDTRTDLFSLGIMLYEMVTGTRPFGGSTTMEVLIAISRDEPKRVSEIAPGTPESLADLIHRCLEKKPEMRVQSCAELISAIDGIAGSSPEPPSSLPEKAPAPAPVTPPARSRARTVAMTALVLALGIAAILAATGKLPTAASPAQGSAAPAPTGPLVVNAIGCKAATLTGTDTSQELAEALGKSACQRVAAELGIEWGVPRAAHTLEVTATLDTGGAHMTLSLGGRSRSADGGTLIDAVGSAAPLLATELATPPLTDTEIRDWGASSEAGAKQVRRAWRGYEDDLLQDPLGEANRILALEPDSPWSHMLVARIDPAKATSELQPALEKANRLTPSRALGMRGFALLMASSSPTSDSELEGIRLLRQAFAMRPDDADMAIIYSDMAHGEERMAIAKQLEGASSTRTVISILYRVINHLRIPPEVRLEALEKARSLLPEIAAWEPSVQLWLFTNRVADARAGVALGEKLGLSEVISSRGSIAQVTLDPETMRSMGIKMLGDRTPSTSVRGDTLIAASYLMEGHIRQGEAKLVERFERRRGLGQMEEAANALFDELFLRRWLDRPLRDAERIAWIEKVRKERPLELGFGQSYYIGLQLPFMSAGNKLGRADADKALSAAQEIVDRESKGLELMRDQQRVGMIPLLRVARGDKEAARQWGEMQRSVTHAGPGAAFDIALALEAAGDRKEAERMYRMTLDTRYLSSTAAVECFALIAARVRLSDLLGAEGRTDEARELSAVVDRVWATADAGLREAVRKMK